MKGNLATWKDDEYGYCLALVASGGNRNVPRVSVWTYLDLQRSCAVRDKRADVAGALDHLMAEWVRQ